MLRVLRGLQHGGDNVDVASLDLVNMSSESSDSDSDAIAEMASKVLHPSHASGSHAKKPKFRSARHFTSTRTRLNGGHGGSELGGMATIHSQRGLKVEDDEAQLPNALGSPVRQPAGSSRLVTQLPERRSRRTSGVNRRGVHASVADFEMDLEDDGSLPDSPAFRASPSRRPGASQRSTRSGRKEVNMEALGASSSRSRRASRHQRGDRPTSPASVMASIMGSRAIV